MESIYGWSLPPDLSAHGWEIDQLIWIVHWFMLILFVGWGLFLAYCLIRFRARKGHAASYSLPRTPLPKALEAGILVVEIFLLIGLSYPAWTKMRDDLPPKGGALEIRVVAQQFAWNFHYPGRDGIFGRTDPMLVTDYNPIGLDRTDPDAVDDLLTLNQMHVPVGQTVILHLSSRDVIHGFFVPVLRVKQDVNPGMTIPIWFQATGTGQYEIACAQLCGVGHSLMRGFVTLDTPQAYDEWVTLQESYLMPPPDGAGGGV